MQDLVAVVYRSQAVRPMAPGELDQLLIEARAFNERTEVSGALLHHHGAFLQYFEGTPAAVEKVYARIRRSHCHEHLVELSHQPIAARQFATWHMAFSEAPATVLEEIANELWTLALPAMRDRPARAPGLQLLLNFWDRVNQQPSA